MTATRTSKKQKVYISKTTTLHVYHASLYISLPSLRDLHVKLPKFTFCRGRVDTGQRFCNSFLKHRYSPLEFISRKIHQHLTNWTTWNKSDEFLNSVNSRFKRRFHHRRGRCRRRCPRGGVLGLIPPPPPTPRAFVTATRIITRTTIISTAPSPSRLWLYCLKTAGFGYLRLK